MTSSFHPSKCEIRALMQRADENLRLGQLELEHGFPRAVVSKAYYIFLDVARAALLSRGIIARTHGGCVAEFGRTFVAGGEISAEYGRWFNRALRARQEADYETLKSFTAEDAGEALEHAKRFHDEMQLTILARLDLADGDGNRGCNEPAPSDRTPRG